MLGMLALSLAGPVAAQAVGAVRGVVRDDEGTVVRGAELRLSPARLNTFANQDGEFRFDSLAPGNYLLLARSPGHEPVRVSFSLGAGVRTVNVTLRRMPQQLDSVLVTEVRRGLYGIVSDSALQPIVGAKIVVHGDRQLAQSDSVGRFAFPELAPGSYGITVEHPGQATRNKVVTVPWRGATEVALQLQPVVPGQPRIPFAATAMRDLGTRLAWGTRSDILGGEELRQYAGYSLCDVPRMWRMFQDTRVIVIENGTRVLRGVSLCDLVTDELELVEWGVNCEDISWGVEMLLGSECDGPRAVWDSRRGVYGTWVMVWTRAG